VWNNTKNSVWSSIYRLVKTLQFFLDVMIFLSFSLLLLYCLWGLYDYLPDSYADYVFQPNNEEEPSYDTTTDFEKLQQSYPDLVAYLILDDTSIKGPIVQAADNEKYLTLDAKGNYNMAGALFLDYRNDANFHDFYSLIYGHHMAGKRRFGELTEFISSSYFKKHLTGSLMTSEATYQLEVFALVETNAYDQKLYYPQGYTTEKEKTKLLSYIEKHATNYRQVEITSEDHIVAFSTCYKDSTNGRVILFAKLVKESDSE